MQGHNNWENWGSLRVMKLWVSWEVLRWLIKFRELYSGGFHWKLVTPPYHVFLNVNIPQNSQNSNGTKCNGKNNNRQHAFPDIEVTTDVKQMPIWTIIIIVQTHAAIWKAATQEQLAGAHLYLHIAKSGYDFLGYSGGMSSVPHNTQ